MFEDIGYLDHRIHNIDSDVCWERLHVLSSEVNYRSNMLLYNLEIHIECLPEVIGVSLYTRVLTNYQALLILAFRGMADQAKIMLRSQLEALFSLGAISNDPSFCNRFVLQDFHQRKRIATKFKRYGEKYEPDEISLISNQENIIASAKEEIERQKIKELSTEEISHKANLHQLYDTVYSPTSSDIHSSARSLESYLVNDDSGVPIGIENSPNYDSTKLPLIAAVDCMLIGVGSVCEIFNIEKISDFDKFKKSLIEINKICF